MHGGSAPQVKLSARARLETYVDPALTALRNLVDTADSDSVRLSAIKDILDRAGVHADDAQVEATAAAMHITVAFDHANDTHADTLETITYSLPDPTD